MASRGNAILEAWEQRRLEERETTPVVARCAWCAWTLAGDVRTTREAHAQHRATDHPDRLMPTRRRRHRPFRQFNSGTNIDDNIANARQQGAATWVSE